MNNWSWFIIYLLSVDVKTLLSHHLLKKEKKKSGLLPQNEMYKYILHKCKAKPLLLLAGGFHGIHETLKWFPLSEINWYQTSMEQWQCTVQTSELLCQIQKFDLESSSRKGSQHVTFIWSAGQNYSTNCSDGRVCQSAQRDETTQQTPKSQKGVIILYACFHWDKPNRSLSGMAFMRINLENEEAGVHI